MSAYIDRRQPIPSVRTVASHINQGGAYQPTASPLKNAVCSHNAQSDLLAHMLTGAQVLNCTLQTSPLLPIANLHEVSSASPPSPRQNNCALPLSLQIVAVRIQTHASCGQDLWGRCAGRNKEDVATLVAGLEKLHTTQVADSTASVALAKAQNRIAQLEQELQAAQKFAQLLEELQQVAKTHCQTACSLGVTVEQLERRAATTCCKPACLEEDGITRVISGSGRRRTPPLPHSTPAALQAHGPIAWTGSAQAHPLFCFLGCCLVVAQLPVSHSHTSFVRREVLVEKRGKPAGLSVALFAPFLIRVHKHV